MASIVLTTLNSRYHHSSFGLRYLFANLNSLQDESTIIEFTISQNTRDIVEKLLVHQPKIIGFGVYIWNTNQTAEVVAMIKKIAPEIKIILGGPEVSYETDTQPLCQIADLTLKGEADFKFYEICNSYLTNQTWPDQKWLQADLPDIQKIKLPYSFYSTEDIQNRTIYVEASRGCPYKCEYCLSSLDKSVRSFDLDLFLAEMNLLIEKGVRQFKFIDRTFNLSPTTSNRILQFFLDRISLGLFLHFEMVPDRLPLELREIIQQFPKGSLQFEIGIQTWNPEVAKRVSRRQDYAKVIENFKFLSVKGNVHTHADLIAGLPSEDLTSFAKGFDAVAELNPDEIQVGILKRLKGTPIMRHDQEWGMVYQDHPPFQILKTKTMDYQTLQQIGRFSVFWDHIANSGNFNRTLKIIKSLALKREDQSLYFAFNDLVLFLSQRHPQSHGVSLLNLLESVWVYLSRFEIEGLPEAMIQDYASERKRDVPHFLKTGKPAPLNPKNTQKPKETKSATPARQKRHLLP